MITHLEVNLLPEECEIVREAMKKSGMAEEERTHDLGRKMNPTDREIVHLNLSLEECDMIAESMQKSGLDKDARTRPIAAMFITALMLTQIGV